MQQEIEQGISHQVGEIEKIGPWNVYFQKDMLPVPRRSYQTAVDDLSGMITQFRYNAMRTRQFACFQTVEMWKKLHTLFPDFTIREAWFGFNPPVEGNGLPTQTGQAMLCLEHGAGGSVILDTAGYLFGFSYQEMSIVVGDIPFQERTLSQIYSNKLPQPVTVSSVSGKAK